MRWGLLALLVIHGLIHFMGFAKAFGLADLPQLTQPISRPVGVAWLGAGLALLSAAALLVLAPRTWWLAGLVGVVLSQAVILSSWGDARFGTLANVVLFAAVAYGFASQGPWSFATEYRDEVRRRSAQRGNEVRLTESELAPLPPPVQRYVRRTGAVGQPKADHVRAIWRGRIRSGADDPWMEFTAEQHNFIAEPARFFHMKARKGGLPVDVLHRFRDASASMRVRLLSLVPLVNASGPGPDRAETVTLLNDLCLLAPWALADPAIRWEAIDDGSARAFYTVGTNTVSAVLVIDEAGDLVDFVSDDRLAASPDGRTFTPMRWSTPVSAYRQFGSLRLFARGEGRWHAPAGEYAYLEIELVALEVGGAGRR